MSKRERIVHEIADALKEITMANGYKTDAGNNVEIEKKFNEYDFEYLIDVFESEDSIINESGSNNARVKLPLFIQIIAQSETSSRHSVKHKLLSDVKKCMLSYRRKKSTDIAKINYPKTNASEQKAGSDYVEAWVIVDIEFHERLGDQD